MIKRATGTEVPNIEKLVYVTSFANQQSEINILKVQIKRSGCKSQANTFIKPEYI